ncbi:hypothetical protein [Aestuariirhabdus sp. LZHN29]|uniref:hypothetical protein n=1 Tax=Aestuariirhabdus sp. LZHN29 TaxID=3417462 RepID=UPI003CF9476D
MEPGHWYRLSGNRPDLQLPPTPPGTRYLTDGDPACDPALNPATSLPARLRRLTGRYAKAPWSGRGDFRSITECWNGAVLATRFGPNGAMICFGGGHNDYFGSDVHAFDLAARQWSRISDGYTSGHNNAYGAGANYPTACYPDGSPLPPHTYGYVQYDPIGNDFMLLKGQQQLGPDVVPTPIPHLFNLETKRWRRGPKHPAAALNSAGFSAWDSARRVLWGHSGDDGNSFTGFYPDGNNGDGSCGHWGPCYPSKLPHKADHNVMAYDPSRDLLLVACHQSNTLLALNPARPAEPPVVLESSSPIAISPFAALEYSAVRERFIYYSALDGSAPYSISAPPGDDWGAWTSGCWRWQPLVSPHNTLDPIADAARHSRYTNNNLSHTFGRFRVARFGGREVAILVRHVDSPVYGMLL